MSASSSSLPGTMGLGCLQEQGLESKDAPLTPELRLMPPGILEALGSLLVPTLPAASCLQKAEKKNPFRALSVPSGLAGMPVLLRVKRLARQIQQKKQGEDRLSLLFETPPGPNSRRNQVGPLESGHEDLKSKLPKKKRQRMNPIKKKAPERNKKVFLGVSHGQTTGQDRAINTCDPVRNSYKDKKSLEQMNSCSSKGHHVLCSNSSEGVSSSLLPSFSSTSFLDPMRSLSSETSVASLLGGVPTEVAPVSLLPVNSNFSSLPSLPSTSGWPRAPCGNTALCNRPGGGNQGLSTRLGTLETIPTPQFHLPVKRLQKKTRTVNKEKPCRSVTERQSKGKNRKDEPNSGKPPVSEADLESMINHFIQMMGQKTEVKEAQPCDSSRASLKCFYPGKGKRVRSEITVDEEEQLRSADKGMEASDAFAMAVPASLPPQIMQLLCSESVRSKSVCGSLFDPQALALMTGSEVGRPLSFIELLRKSGENRALADGELKRQSNKQNIDIALDNMRPCKFGKPDLRPHKNDFWTSKSLFLNVPAMFSPQPALFVIPPSYTADSIAEAAQFLCGQQTRRPCESNVPLGPTRKKGVSKAGRVHLNGKFSVDVKLLTETAVVLKYETCSAEQLRVLFGRGSLSSNKRNMCRVLFLDADNPGCGLAPRVMSVVRFSLSFMLASTYSQLTSSRKKKVPTDGLTEKRFKEAIPSSQ